MKAAFLPCLTLALLSIVSYATAQNITNVQDMEVVDFKVDIIWGNKIYLKWHLPSNVDSSAIEGFRLFYKIDSKRTSTQYSVQNLTNAYFEDGLWSAIATLETPKKRYAVEVRPYSGQEEGRPREPEYIYVTGRPLYVTPHIAVRATPVATDAVLVSYRILGDRNLSNANFFYMEEGQTEWQQATWRRKKVQGDGFLVLAVPNGNTTYYIFGKSWMDNRNYQIGITFVKTPGDNSEIQYIDDISRNLALTKQYKAVDWSHWQLEDVKGYKITVDFAFPGRSKILTNVYYKPGDDTRIDFSSPGTILYNVKVEPFNEFGLLGSAEARFSTPRGP
ncbi:hypothetical protein RRG08_060107 [Elysia crispata]|uniref:Fibronectin type-III domain-containing protein n=1 Tax=Elysia crispata TaxID=231223 RepID=A0AAE1BBL7_9GAST|nr:hypothetical protein RRG08_060107 [Elysia crispata]